MPPGLLDRPLDTVPRSPVAGTLGSNGKEKETRLGEEAHESDPLFQEMPRTDVSISEVLVGYLSAILHERVKLQGEQRGYCSYQTVIPERGQRGLPRCARGTRPRCLQGDRNP